jgi:hypothetical protein
MRRTPGPAFDPAGHVFRLSPTRGRAAAAFL